MTTAGVVRAICEDLAADVQPGAGASEYIAAAQRAARVHLPLAGADEIEAAARAAVAQVHGLGPLQMFLADPRVNEIMVNNGGDVWIEREGTIALAGRLEADVVPRLIERTLSPLGRRLDRLSPIVDARLPDGSRICAVIPPIAIDGPCLSLRRFGIRRRALTEYASDEITDLLRDAVAARCNILISGATSSGKTSLLNTLASCIGDEERIITLEDTAELALHAAHVLRLETRPATAEGTSAVTMTDLVRTALRLRPDRIIVGEIRGAEVTDMVLAMNTGHDGSLSTCHANGPADALRRLESLLAQHAPTWSLRAVRDTIRASIDVVVHVARTATGDRRVTDVLELGDPSSNTGHRCLAQHERVVGSLQRRRR
ncbi:MAG TPA: ATPase, T2SS/T4P/T4SS family [Ilumatobacteraceae bacterium]